MPLSEEARKKIAERMQAIFRSEAEKNLKALMEEGGMPEPLAEHTEWMAQLAMEKPGEGAKELEAFEQRMKDHVWFQAIMSACFAGMQTMIRELEEEGLLHTHDSGPLDSARQTP